MFFIERPLLLLLIPCAFFVLLLVIFRFKSVSRVLFGKKDVPNRWNFSFFSKMICAFLFWTSAILASSGISFGTEAVFVSKTASSVCFVFDISHSMEAVDFHGFSRLDSSKKYASAILNHLPSSTVAAVIAKGAGFLALPLTDDVASFDLLLTSLSPALMTAAGSSLGSGIDCAVNALKNASSSKNSIVIFTDGDETDGKLLSEVEKAVLRGIQVFFVGFGSETGADVTAGDGKTRVWTALKSKELSEICKNANRVCAASFGEERAHFVLAEKKGSAARLISALSLDENGTEKEMRPVSRHRFFEIGALLFFVLSIFLNECNVSRFFQKKRAVFSAIFSVFFLAGCSKNGFQISQKLKTVKGVAEYKNGDFFLATADFYPLIDSQDERTRAYAFFNVAATYIALDELDAALEKLSNIAFLDVLENDFLSAVSYNQGVIFFKKGDFQTAAEFFKKSILLDGENADAKINLEFCQKKVKETEHSQKSKEINEANEKKSEASLREQAIFTILREAESERYKNFGGGEEKDDVLDY